MWAPRSWDFDEIKDTLTVSRRLKLREKNTNLEISSLDKAAEQHQAPRISERPSTRRSQTA